MIRTLFRTALPIVFAASAGSALAEPALWRVSDADSSVWLFGSVHIMGRDAAWRSPALDELIANADQVVFEMLLDPEGMAAVTRLTVEHGYLPSEQVLTDLLTDDEAQRLDAALEALNLQPFVVARMQPWLAGVTIATMALAASTGGEGFGTGVEAEVQAEVADERERGLETPEEQIGFATAGTREEQIAGLMQAVDQVGQTAADFRSLIDAWLEGDVDGLHQVIETSMGSIEDPTYRLFVTDRNRRWTETIAGMLADDTDALIIVGAAHVVGPVGLPTMLEDRGFAVERIQ